MEYTPKQNSRTDSDTKTGASSANGPARAMLIAVAASFLFGGAIVAYLGYTFYRPEPAVAPISAADEEAASVLGGFSPPVPTADDTTDEAMTVQTVERVEEQQGGIDQRLAAAEQRLTRLDLQAQAAAGNAARAEGLLIAFATRRAMERGAELGYLADQLRLRFGDALPNAVGTIVETSRDPITLDRLLARLEGLGPAISKEQTDPSWQRVSRELSELFVIRRETSPSPQPERRLERARLFLESGRIDDAIAEVRNMPGAGEAGRWIADARRFAASQRALDLIETAAVLEPRRLRDGAGNRIGQSSPVSDSAAN